VKEYFHIAGYLVRDMKIISDLQDKVAQLGIK